MAQTKVRFDRAVEGATNIVDSGTEGTRVAKGTQAQRGTTQGQLRFNTDTGLAEYYTGTVFKAIDSPPTISSVGNSNITESQISSNYDLTITGSSFNSGATVKFIGNDDTEYSSPTVTVNSDTSISARVPTSVTNANEPYDVKVTNNSGLSAILADAFNVDAKPAWTTSAGSLGTFVEGSAVSTSVTATDPEGETITYGITSGSLPSGLSLNTSSGAITGTAPLVTGDTTSTFTVTATAGSQTNSREFTITIREPIVSTFSYTGSGQTFTAPVGVTSFTAYMWGAGGAGGSTEGGLSGTGGNGGAGGYVSASISNFSAQQSFGILVGQSNESDNDTVVRSFGGGGNGGAKVSQRIGGAGGGRSEINIGTVGNTPNGIRILVAGGGGGGNARYSNNEPQVNARATGGTIGADGSEPSGQTGTPPTGGTQSAGGARGSGINQNNFNSAYWSTNGQAGIGGYATGGNIEIDTSYGAGGGGGGGYYGGGGGDGGVNPPVGAHSGAGGSGYSNPSYCSNVTHDTGSGTTAPQTGNTYYGSNAGVGGSGKQGIGSSGTAGGHGRVVIVY